MWRVILRQLATWAAVAAATPLVFKLSIAWSWNITAQRMNRVFLTLTRFAIAGWWYSGWMMVGWLLLVRLGSTAAMQSNRGTGEWLVWVPQYAVADHR
jgi:hypothetical protein